MEESYTPSANAVLPNTADDAVNETKEISEIETYASTITRDSTYATIEYLGDLRPEEPNVNPYNINNKGEVVGDAMVGNSSQAFLWKDGIMRGLGILDSGWGSTGVDVSDNGEIVGYSTVSISENSPTYVFTSRGGVIYNTGIIGTVRAVNIHGDMVGELAKLPYGGIIGSYLWKEGKIIELPFEPSDINDNGQIVGTYSATGNYYDSRAVIWEDGIMTTLNTLGGRYSRAEGINNKGQIIGYSETEEKNDTSIGKAFVWENGTMTTIDVNAIPSDINNKGQVVVKNYVWDNGNLFDINGLMSEDADWRHISTLSGINDHGQIVGAGLYQEAWTGNFGFILTLPEVIPDDVVYIPDIDKLMSTPVEGEEIIGDGGDDIVTEEGIEDTPNDDQNETKK